MSLFTYTLNIVSFLITRIVIYRPSAQKNLSPIHAMAKTHKHTHIYLDDTCPSADELFLTLANSGHGNAPAKAKDSNPDPRQITALVSL